MGWTVAEVERLARTHGVDIYARFTPTGVAVMALSEPSAALRAKSHKVEGASLEDAVSQLAARLGGL